MPATIRNLTQRVVQVPVVSYTFGPLEVRTFPFTEYDDLYNNRVVRRLMDIRVIDLRRDDSGVVAPHVTTHESGGTDTLDHQQIPGTGIYTHAQIDTTLGGIYSADVLYSLQLAEDSPGAYKQLIYTGTDLTTVLLYDGPFVAATAARSLTFVNASPARITASSGSFVTDGFVGGVAVGVRGTAANDGIHMIATVAATVLTMAPGVVFANEGPFVSDVSVHNLIDLKFSKVLGYTTGSLVSIEVTRLSDGAAVRKFLTYTPSGDLQQISLQN